ncbi:hypothetical protein [Pedobacter frigoris]|uniref:Lipoprotein n=1 Tax=Pedobacter frigoris TaxID=2571272 RepID=A0A4U1CGA3_9SPHI|nr:hypothetical protein [Pedobacter frigoris]TKC04136.1 hypothetical protein FA047_16145 [Pedobacter frigoris]
MKRLNLIAVTIMSLLFSCSNKNIKEIISENLKKTENWKLGDDIPSFLLENEYSNTYYHELYEYGGLANVALINQIKDKDLLLSIIGSCNQIIDSKPRMQVLEDIDFGENRLFDMLYNYSTRQIAILRYKILYGPKELATQIENLNPVCKGLNLDTMRLINSIKYSENQQASLGFIIDIERTKLNKPLKVDTLKMEKIASQVLFDASAKLTFKKIDLISKEMINSIVELNPNDTFKIDYTGPYIFDTDIDRLTISKGTRSVKLSFRIRKVY